MKIRKLRFPSGNIAYQYLDVGNRCWYSAPDVAKLASQSAIDASPLFDVHADGVSSSLDPVQRVAMMAPITSHVNDVLEPVMRALKRLDPDAVLAELDASNDWSTYGVSYTRDDMVITLEVL